jgi:lantibiotic modifying enzyme
MSQSYVLLHSTELILIFIKSRIINRRVLHKTMTPRGYFQQSCLHQVQNTLQNMNEADLSQQTGIIKLV